MIEDNGKVTLALVGQKLDTFIQSQQETQKKQQDVLEQLMALVSTNSKDIALLKASQIETNKDLGKLAVATDKAIDNLNTKFSLFSGGNSALGAIALAVAAFFGSK